MISKEILRKHDLVADTEDTAEGDSTVWKFDSYRV